MNKTEHYSLNQWQLHDRVMMQDFNADNATLDAALNDHEGRVAVLEQRAPHWGNCQIYTTSYTGNGTCGEGHPNTLTFPRKPALVIIVSSENGRPLCMAYGCPSAYLDTNGTASKNNTVTWSGNTVSWHSEHVMGQMNVNGARYYVTMFSTMD